MLLLHRLHRGSHRRSCRESVIDQNDGAAGEGRHGSRAVVQRLAARQFSRFALSDTVDDVRADAERLGDLVVDYADSSGSDRAHGEFGVPRNAELADDEGGERRVKGPRDLVGHGDAAARQG